MCEEALQTYIGDYSVQRVDQDKVKGGGGGRGQTDLKVLVVVRIDAETRDKAVHHELHISILTACPPPEGLGWVEQQSLVGQGGPQVTSGHSKAHFQQALLQTCHNSLLERVVI